MEPGYVIAIFLFFGLTKYAIYGDEMKKIAPIIYVIGGILWPLVLAVSLVRSFITFVNWLFNARV